MEKKATRFGFGEALVELGKENNKIFVLGADTVSSVALNSFATLFPTRFLNVGIAETNLVGIAAGLSLVGFIPFISTYSIFISGRAWEQIRNTICYSNLNVKIGGSHSGITVGADGATHQALEDISIMRCIPNMNVICPCDFIETKKAVIASSKLAGPVYIRYSREETPIITNHDTPFNFGKANILEHGDDVAIIACGNMVYEALKATQILKNEKHIHATLINLHTIKPIDEDSIIKVAKKCKAIVSVEEHQIYGGLGSAISEVLGAKCPTPIEMIGMYDTFGESGKPSELLAKFKLTSYDIINRVLKVIQRKHTN
ncbi:MAG: transketolase family protein [Endomicrobium sp.]|jgi:transketolase|nr:transketolase family protein [Endomicrobium sp.]